MSAFGIDGFGQVGEVRPVSVDVYTAHYRVSGTVQTRFSRVAEILNQVSSTHLVVEQATISEHVDASAGIGAPFAYVAVEEILLMVAGDVGGAARDDMRIPKRPVRAQLGLPPFSVAGRIHVPMGSRPIDGLLNLHERFIPMTDVELTCAAHPQLNRRAAAMAVRRDRAHLLLVADDENPDALLAEILDERTAEAWLRAAEQE